MIEELVKRNRSCRRFAESEAVGLPVLRQLVDLARLSASGANLQPLKFVLSADPELNARIFPHLAWAGYLADWPGPAPGERPAAYIVILHDTGVAADCGCDHGIAAQSIMLGAAARGLGGCLIGSIKRRELDRALGLDPKLRIKLVLALGRPAEEVVLEPVGADGSVRYWRDEAGVHHVPKRSLDELIVKEQ